MPKPSQIKPKNFKLSFVINLKFILIVNSCHVQVHVHFKIFSVLNLIYSVQLYSCNIKNSQGQIFSAKVGSIPMGHHLLHLELVLVSNIRQGWKNVIDIMDFFLPSVAKSKFEILDKSPFAAVKVLFISDISCVSYNIWLTMIVNRHLFL